MKQYLLKLEFKDERHCLYCPLRDVDDACRAIKLYGKSPICLTSWEEQLTHCPLIYTDSYAEDIAGLRARVAELEAALELSSELHAQSGGCPADIECVTGCADCWRDYWLQQAKAGEANEPIRTD